MKKTILTLIISLSNICIWAQTRVKIGDLYYELSGAYASVVSSRPIPQDCRTSQPSLYTNEIYIIPSSVTYQGLEYTVTEIGYAAFAGWSNYNASPYFNSSSAIGSTAKKIIMPPTINKISTYAFANCRNLTSLVIPENVTYIDGSSAFLNCDLLRDIFYLSSAAPTNWYATSNTYVPTLDKYKTPSYLANQAQIKEYISFTTKEFIYAGTTPNVEWNNNVTGYEIEIDLSSVKKDVGTYTTQVPLQLTKDSEVINVNIPFSYTIKRAPLTIKIDNATREYGEENPIFTYTIEGFINGEDSSSLSSLPTIYSSATKKSNVGTYSITGDNASSSNYAITYSNGTLTIEKAPLSAKVIHSTKVYGDNNPNFKLEFEGLKNGETVPSWNISPSFNTEATKKSTVGEYSVTATGKPVNYELSDITAGTLTIVPAQLTITANNATRQYYEENPEFKYSFNGFVNNETEEALSSLPTLSTTAVKTSKVGEYTIKVSGSASPNYDISYKDGILKVNPRTLTVSVGNYERVFNDDNPKFEINYDGFAENEDEKVLNEKPSVKTSAIKTSDVGTYKIEVTGGSADNYTFSYVSGVLTINKAEQTISWEQNLRNLKVGDQVELKAVASSGLPITYTTDNDAVEIYTAGSKTYMDCKAGGQFVLRAIQNGNNNYYSSPKVSNTVKIEGSSSTDVPQDVNSDGVVDTQDVLEIYKYIQEH